MYEFTAYYNQYNHMNFNNGYNNGYDMHQMNMVGNPLTMMNQMPPQTQNPIMNGNHIPPSMMRPNGNEAPGSNLGFQMNPVSKNSKKK
jgi:hypothetical protein